MTSAQIVRESQMKKLLEARASRAAIAAAALLGGAVFAVSSVDAASEREVTLTVLSVRALDKVDEFSKGDLYARVTIDGETFKTDPVKQSNIDKPNWKVKKKVKPGEIKVKLEILDKDLTQDDAIDINRVDNKRDLDFTVDTKSCKIGGFASTYKCGATIARQGGEKKKAEIKFKVDVK